MSTDEPSVRKAMDQPTMTEDFCGVQRECSLRETGAGTKYCVAKWTCPNCGRACSMLYIDDESCHGDTLCISHVDGVRTIACGGCLRAPEAAPYRKPGGFLRWNVTPVSKPEKAAPEPAPDRDLARFLEEVARHAVNVRGQLWRDLGVEATRRARKLRKLETD